MDREKRTIRILATSDVHGMFFPWAYSSDEEHANGSLAQISTIVRKLYDPEDTVLVDAGDIMQGNAAELFTGEDIHPMVKALGDIGYDIWLPGNHDFDYGMDYLRSCMDGFSGQALIGNLTGPDGKHITDGCTVITRKGLRIAFICMETPVVPSMLPAVFTDHDITDPVEETHRLLDQLNGQYDVLVGILHMGLRPEYGTKHSSVAEFAEEFPEFDALIASHSHEIVEGTDINGVHVAENLSDGRTVLSVSVTAEKTEEGWKTSGCTSEIIRAADHLPDEAICDKYHDYHDKALSDAHQPVGSIVDEEGVPYTEYEDNIPNIITCDTPLIDFLHNVFLHYSGADVAAVAVSDPDTSIRTMQMRKCDISRLYKFRNNLSVVRMTGKQLIKFMEYSAAYYKTRKEKDAVIEREPSIKQSSYFMFGGITYEIDLKEDTGHRIQNVRWPDGRPLQDSDVFNVAANDFAASLILTKPGYIFDENDIPEIIEENAGRDIGTVPDLIADYIRNVCGGKLELSCDESWKLVYGND